MTIEQTTQLIQLILNAVLMLGACGIVLCGALIHQAILEHQSRALSTSQALGQSTSQSSRAIRHQLHSQQRQTRRAIFWITLACWLLGVSCGALVLRSVWQLNALIPLSLGLFAIACALFLIGSGSLLLSVMTHNEPIGSLPSLENSQPTASSPRLASSPTSSLTSSPRPTKVVNFKSKTENLKSSPDRPRRHRSRS